MDDILPGDHFFGFHPSSKANISPIDDFPSKLALGGFPSSPQMGPFPASLNAACNGTLLSAFQLLFRRVAQFFASVQQSYQIPGSKLSPAKKTCKGSKNSLGIFGIWWGLFLKLPVGEGSCGLLYPTKRIKSLSQV